MTHTVIPRCRRPPLIIERTALWRPAVLAGGALTFFVGGLCVFRQLDLTATRAAADFT